MRIIVFLELTSTTGGNVHKQDTSGERIAYTCNR